MFQNVIEFDTMDKNWEILLKILPTLFDNLEFCATNFRRNTAQTTFCFKNDFDQELSNIMRYTLQIFYYIFR